MHNTFAAFATLHDGPWILFPYSVKNFGRLATIVDSRLDDRGPRVLYARYPRQSRGNEIASLRNVWPLLGWVFSKVDARFRLPAETAAYPWLTSASRGTFRALQTRRVAAPRNSVFLPLFVSSRVARRLTRVTKLVQS